MKTKIAAAAAALMTLTSHAADVTSTPATPDLPARAPVDMTDPTQSRFWRPEFGNKGGLVKVAAPAPAPQKTGLDSDINPTGLPIKPAAAPSPAASVAPSKDASGGIDLFDRPTAGTAVPAAPAPASVPPPNPMAKAKVAPLPVVEAPQVVDKPPSQPTVALSPPPTPGTANLTGLPFSAAPAGASPPPVAGGHSILPMQMQGKNAMPPPAPLLPASALPPGVQMAAVQSNERLIRDNATSGGDLNIAPETIQVLPGVNQIIPIARAHLNRIVTPIYKPIVKTTSGATIEAKGSVLYVSPQDEQPIALYITREGTEDKAILVTLMPKAMPPREVRLTMDESVALSYQASTSAQKWEEEQPYVNTLRNLLRGVATGAVPPGYTLRRHSGKDPAVFCSDPYLRVTPVQVMEGHNLVVTVSAAKNIGGRDITINELQCQLPGVAAVAVYPTPHLRPGMSSELYVVHRRYAAVVPPRDRPSVIDPDYLR